MERESPSLQRIIYVAQSLAGCAAVGAIFADGQVTKLRVAFATVAVLASIAGIVLAMRTATDQARMEKKLQLVMEGQSLPYTLEADVNARVDRIAIGLGLKPQNLSRFKGLNCYFFQNSSGTRLLLALRDKELRDLFLAQDDEVKASVTKWLTSGPSAAQIDEIAREVVFCAVGEATADEMDSIDPMHVKGSRAPDGSSDYEFTFPKSGAPPLRINVNAEAWGRKAFAAAIGMADLFDKVRHRISCR